MRVGSPPSTIEAELPPNMLHVNSAMDIGENFVHKGLNYEVAPMKGHINSTDDFLRSTPYEAVIENQHLSYDVPTHMVLREKPDVAGSEPTKKQSQSVMSKTATRFDE